MPILLFEDYPDDTETRALCERLERAGIEYECVRTTRAFENEVRKTVYDIVILDVMAEASDVMYRYNKPKIRVPNTETGLELLRRCRGGYYKTHAEHYKTIPIYIRTANSPDHMQMIYQKEGGIYIDVAENRKLVELIVEYLNA